MKSPVFLTALILAVQVPVHAQASKPLTTNVERFSYGVGLQIGQQLKRQGLSGIDPRAITMAIEDVLAGRDLRVSMDDMRVAATAYQNELNSEKLAAADKNKVAGDEFLAGNSTREGIVVLDSGLQYRVVESGAGESPRETDTVVVRTVRETNYEEKLKKKTRTSGCAVGTVFGDVMESFDEVVLDADARQSG